MFVAEVHNVYSRFGVKTNSSVSRVKMQSIAHFSLFDKKGASGLGKYSGWFFSSAVKKMESVSAIGQKRANLVFDETLTFIVLTKFLFFCSEEWLNR